MQPLKTLIAILLVIPMFLMTANAKKTNWTTHLENIEKHAPSLELPFETELNPQTIRSLKSYFTTGKLQAERILGKSYLYFPVFEHYLQVYNLPNYLKYVPFVESRLEAEVYSMVGAAGLWQFMPATARHYGLRVNEHVDERLDPYKSTEAAVRMLAELHEEFEDWALALAAYNCGPGRVHRAIKRSGSREYAKLMRFLPRQTRQYIPRFVAAAYLGEKFHIHEMSPRCLHQQLEEVRVMKVHRYLSFNQIVAVAGVSWRMIEFLNPSFLEEVLPPSQRGNYLVLPETAMAKLRFFIKQKERAKNKERRFTNSYSEAPWAIHHYVVLPGDSLDKVAERLGYCDHDILAWNGLEQHALTVHQELVLYPNEHRINHRP